MNVSSTRPDDEEWLRGFLSTNRGISGTIHKVRGEFLVLTATVNIPAPVQAAIAKIPRGKGMAGLSWERDQPVTTCNLKEDTSGNVAPGAKTLSVGAGVALPVHDDNHAIRAIVGIAYDSTREITQSEIQNLSIEASTLP